MHERSQTHAVDPSPLPRPLAHSVNYVIVVDRVRVTVPSALCNVVRIIMYARRSIIYSSDYTAGAGDNNILYSSEKKKKKKTGALSDG